MQFISDGYCKLNQSLHSSRPDYGTTGKNHVRRVLELSNAFNTKDILDYGCGKSTLAINLPFSINQYDPAVPKHNRLPDPADIVICTDVFEHIEPEYLDNVLDHIRSLTKKIGYFNAATRPAVKKLDDGRNAHLIVESAQWWTNKLFEYFNIINFSNNNDMEVNFIVKRKEK